MALQRYPRCGDAAKFDRLDDCMQNVFLVGMPSSGKSTLGKLLATELGYSFLDLDQSIVEDQQRSIPEIFSTFGQTYFREVESRILKAVPAHQRLLIATGGGAPCFYDNMDFILNNGIAIFLDVPAAELASRIRKHAVDDRPLLSGLSDLEKDLQQKLEVRRSFYSRANLTVTPDVDLKTLAKRILPLTQLSTKE